MQQCNDTVKYSGVFDDNFITDLPSSLSVKNYDNCLAFGEDTGKSMV